MSRVLFYVASMILAGLLFSCVLTKTGKTVAGMKQNGKSVVVSTGAELSVVLDSNPTTGYVWAVPNFDPDLLRLKENKFIPDEKSGEIMVGVGGKRIFTFIALKKGETLLNTFRSRPWEKNKLISKFSLTVRVRD